MRERNKVLLSGYAKLPTNITAEMVYEVLAVAVLFDRRSGIILEAEASMVTNIARKFIAGLLVGYNLNDGTGTTPEGGYFTARFFCPYL